MSEGLLGGSCLVLAVAALATRRDRRVAALVAGLAPELPSPRPGAATFLPLLRRIGSTGPLAWVVGDGRLHRRLRLAGDPFAAEEVAGAKAVFALLLPATLALGAPRMSLALVAVVAVAAFWTPDLLLARAAARRQAAIEWQVPELVEVLVATAEAGLAPAVALSRSHEVLHGPLAEEVAHAVAEIELGVPWREALARLAARTDAPALRRVATVLARSGRLGTPVRASLAGVATELRDERRARAEERARRAPVQMLFPLVFLILPAFLLLTVGPVVLATLRSLQSGG